MAKSSAGECKSAGRADSWSYLEWQRRIFENILVPQAGGRSVSLFIDGAELERICCCDADVAKKSLVTAVASQFSGRGGWRLFEPIERQIAKWRSDDQAEPPPVLPLLAVSVLAATEFDSTQKFNPNAYYPRLAELFSRYGYEISPKELLSAFDDMDSFWELLANWVKNDSRFESFPLVAMSRLRRIGYSLTQAVVRATDRARLTAFFDAIALDPENVPDEGELLRALRIWAARERGLSSRFVEILRGNDARQLLMPTLMSLASRWDKRVVEATGRNLLSVLLALDLDDAHAEWVVPVRKEVQHETLTSDAFGSIEISQPDYGSLYELSTALPAVSATIDRKFSFSGEFSIAVHRPKPVYVLTFDELAGKWVECGGIEPFDEHVIAVASSVAQQVGEVIRQAADTDWRVVRQPQTHVILRGYAIYESVVFSDKDAFASALESAPNIGANLRPDRPPVPHLVNGLRLPVERIGGRHHYLEGGEPDLVLPKGEAPEQVRVSLDGISQTLWTSDFPVPLRASPPLVSGTHVLEVGNRKLEFQIHEGLPKLSFGRNPEDEEEAESWVHTLDESLEADIWTLPRGKTECWVIDYGGQLRSIEKPEVPEWIAEAGLLEPSRFTPVLYPNDVWLVRTAGTLVVDVQKVGVSSPVPTVRDEFSDEFLQRLADSNHALSNPELQVYLSVWRAGGSVE
ncbi:hypothetical protein [Rhodococcus rhodochrous]|uniref:hypothetical protein n=1 Tax=Rhodococcus rhodochrous TaxID=1829 RepID=UPI0012FDF7E0|nr:hypothetical protein [Rhodococcus rhodochrous]